MASSTSVGDCGGGAFDVDLGVFEGVFEGVFDGVFEGVLDFAMADSGDERGRNWFIVACAVDVGVDVLYRKCFGNRSARGSHWLRFVFIYLDLA